MDPNSKSGDHKYSLSIHQVLPKKVIFIKLFIYFGTLSSSTLAPFIAIAEVDKGARVEKSHVVYFGGVYFGARGC